MSTLTINFNDMIEKMIGNNEEITNAELSYIIGDLTQQTINKYTQELEKKGYLIKIKQRPLTYTLSDEITDKL